MWVPSGSPCSRPLFPASLPAPGFPTYCPLHPFTVEGTSVITHGYLGPTTKVQLRGQRAGLCTVHTALSTECYRQCPLSLSRPHICHSFELKDHYSSQERPDPQLFPKERAPRSGWLGAPGSGPPNSEKGWPGGFGKSQIQGHSRRRL